MNIFENSLIFDFDGVISESIPAKTNAFKQLFSKFNTTIQNKVVKHHLENGGMSRYVKIKYYYENFVDEKITQKQLRNYCEQFSDLVLKKVIESPLVPGIKNFLEKNYKLNNLFISTGTPQNEIEKIVDEINIKQYFINVYGSPDKKEKHLERISKKYNLSFSKMTFIGDSQTDYSAAKKKKVKFILRKHKDNEKFFSNYKGKIINDFSSIDYFNN